MKTMMERRMEAAQACLDRFAGKSYDPRARRDCAWMARHDLHHLGRRVGQGKLPTYTTELGGIRALKRTGFASLIDYVDSLGLERIAPASALAADIVALPTDHPLGSLSVNVGNGRLLAYVDGYTDAVVIEPKAFVCAWRVI